MNEITSNHLEKFLNENQNIKSSNSTDIIQATNTSNDFLSEINKILENINNVMNNPLFQNKILKKENINNIQSPPPLQTEPPKIESPKPKINKKEISNKVFIFVKNFLDEIVEIKPEATIKELLDDLKEKENTIKNLIEEQLK